MIEVEKLKKYAEDLEFTMKEEEYLTLQSEFNVLLKQVDLIDKIDGIKDYEPMDFPFSLEVSYLREDQVRENLSREDALKNAKNTQEGCVCVPKVVE